MCVEVAAFYQLLVDSQHAYDPEPANRTLPFHSPVHDIIEILEITGEGN